MNTSTKEYEDLMRWVMNDIRDLPKDVKGKARKQFNDYLMMTVMNLDMFCVINNETEFQRFKTDLIN
ncbi:hypothetical protein CIL05_07050 [Virgibacillus profundi]|uniref:Uncharacterized protein n=1 Tax=Virgibacillus profundi TaxID=2024555 RepID=A0A2A2IEZ7_9BACI|nr:hypothetical protein [Virgibacillus profundi]PAV30217.1 hypothetical protein CIL05_07050 [Virgibacillus profundi]PXY54389.1 hypothetical protein CIT14_07135 [Virgibacillus profundi]